MRLRLPPQPPGLVAVSIVAARDLAPLPALPLATDLVPAGFPSPASTNDCELGPVDLQDIVGGDAPSCFFLRVVGESMTGAGILDGDILVVNTAAEPVSGSVVVALLDGEFTVKRFVTDEKGPRLLAEHPDYPPIWVERHQEAEVWGVVTFSLHDHRRQKTVRRTARAA